MRFYSSKGEDKWIVKNMKLPEKGFYVDIGAAHPTRMSNTAFLRDRGWEGIQIDADSFWTPFWDKLGLVLFNRVVWTESTKINFEVNKSAHRLSKIGKKGIKTQAINLNDFLQEYSFPHIDFMSLDVEGSEYEVFKTLHKKYWPDTIVFEYNTLGSFDFRLKKYLQDSGYYKELHRTPSNFIFGTKRDEKSKRIGVDIDGTLTVETRGLNFENRTPRLDIIRQINKWFNEGHTITLFSSRLNSDKVDTMRWLLKYGVKHHTLILNKPVFDVYIDDISIKPEEILNA